MGVGDDARENLARPNATGTKQGVLLYRTVVPVFKIKFTNGYARVESSTCPIVLGK